MILLIRVIPFLVGLLEAAVFWQQRLHPTWYPWMVLVGVSALPISALVIAWRQISLRDLIEKMAPSFLFILALAFALLLVEGVMQVVALVACAAVASWLSLEVLFLMARHPSAYPVNGISRVNMGYVPLILWYAVSTSIGLMTFLHTDRVWHVVLTTMLGVILFRTTGHPTATSRQNYIWTLVGALAGCEIGVMGLLLPVSMHVQGFIAAAVLTGVLRVRRYVYDPKPSVRIAWGEAVTLGIVCILSLTTAKWY